MVYNFFRFFHIAIIAFFLFGCGYKADPVWPGTKQKNEVNQSDLKLLDLNTTFDIR